MDVPTHLPVVLTVQHRKCVWVFLPAHDEWTSFLVHRLDLITIGLYHGAVFPALDQQFPSVFHVSLFCSAAFVCGTPRSKQQRCLLIIHIHYDGIMSGLMQEGVLISHKASRGTAEVLRHLLNHPNPHHKTFKIV